MFKQDFHSHPVSSPVLTWTFYKFISPRSVSVHPAQLMVHRNVQNNGRTVSVIIISPKYIYAILCNVTMFPCILQIYEEKSKMKNRSLHDVLMKKYIKW